MPPVDQILDASVLEGFTIADNEYPTGFGT